MLELRDVSLRFDGNAVLNRIDLTVEEGEIVCLLGPSGCGKTTLLRVIAGLQDEFDGDVLLNGQSIKSIPASKRDFGLMFQDFALFPHMNVAENVAFGLKMQHISKQEREKHVQQSLLLVGLDGYQERDVSSLSGGERQRVALARSLAPNPRLLMLDEPLGSLDAKLRDELAIELRYKLKLLGMTAIYVTHDQQEAFVMGNRVAVMNAGQIDQIATPQNLYHQPSTSFVARFLGFENIYDVTAYEDGKAVTLVGRFEIKEKDAVSLLFHPDYLQVVDYETRFIGRVISVVYRGAFYWLHVLVNYGVLSLKLPSTSSYFPQLEDKIYVEIKPDGIIAFTSK